MCNILEVKGLRKAIGDFHLSDISFTVPRGCIMGLIGIDGSGKTTIIKCLANLFHRDSGEVEYWGMNIDKAEREIKNRIGIILENNTLYNSLTIRETADIISNAYSDWQEPLFQECWKRWNDKEHAPKQKLSSLSKKEKLVLSIALAIAHKAEILILDEPFRDIDAVDCGEILDILKEFVKDDNHGILISSHNGMDITSVADELILINKGKMVFRDEKDILIEKHRRVKGPLSMLTQIPANSFLKIDKGEFGFAGICIDYDSIKPYCSSLIVERPTIAEIMMAYMGK